MAEYIEREALLDKLKERDLCLCVTEWDIKDAPAADVAPVWHGHWISEQDGGTRCSACNKRVRDTTGGGNAPVDLSKMPYCPKCGAKMDKEENHE